MRLCILAAAFAALALPAAAQDCADGQRAFEHLGGTTCIPEAPQRIVSLHDQQITLTLIELGAPVVGSHGRTGGADDEPFMRSVRLIYGMDFDNSGIAYVGSFGAMDYEAIAALDPDLIIGREWEMEARERFEAVAPTVLIDRDAGAPLDFSRAVADAAGHLRDWERMNAAFEATVARARAALPVPEGTTYAKIQVDLDGAFTVYAGYGGLTLILEQLGLERVPFAQEMSDRGVAWGEDVSPEIIPQLNADYVFDTYTIAYGDTLADPAGRLTNIFPAWCDMLSACGEGRYIVLPREYASGMSFAELNATVHLVTTHIARSPAE
ncbi:MAG: ABC transporter substrate-binding protein [Pseudomonadota bacterium]